MGKPESLIPWPGRDSGSSDYNLWKVLELVLLASLYLANHPSQDRGSIPPPSEPFMVKMHQRAPDVKA